MHVSRRASAGPPNFNCRTPEAATIGRSFDERRLASARYCDECRPPAWPVTARFHANDMAVAYRWFGNVHGDEDDDVHLMLDLLRHPTPTCVTSTT